MIGTKFGKWTVIKATDQLITKQQLKAWLCRCDCGKSKALRAVSETALKSGKSKSCGRCTPWREWKPKKQPPEQKETNETHTPTHQD